MIKKNITITEQQDQWIKSKIEKGHFDNESEIIRELIQERQMQEQETPAEIEAIRAALIEGENSGLSDMTVEEIWEEARRRRKTRYA